MDIAEIRDGLKTRLATVSGLRCHDTIPDKVTPPAAVVVPDEPFIDYQQAFNGGLCFVFLKVTLLTARSSSRSGQDQLDGFLSAGTGETTSVLDAIAADPTLGGKVDFCVVLEANDYGTTAIGDVEYLKADLRLRAQVGRE